MKERYIVRKCTTYDYVFLKLSEGGSTSDTKHVHTTAKMTPQEVSGYCMGGFRYAWMDKSRDVYRVPFDVFFTEATAKPADEPKQKNEISVVTGRWYYLFAHVNPDTLQVEGATFSRITAKRMSDREIRDIEKESGAVCVCREQQRVKLAMTVTDFMYHAEFAGREEACTDSAMLDGTEG